MKYHITKDPIRIYNEILGGKWRLLIIFQLFSKTQRFKDLHLNIEGITPRMLTKELRMLEKYNLVEKEVYREVPPRVEYSLTDIGVKLFPLIENIQSFGERFSYLLEEESEERNGEMDDFSFEKVEFSEVKVEKQLKKQESEESPLNQEVQNSEVDESTEKSTKPIKIKKAKTEKPKKDDEHKVVQLELF